MTKFKLLSCLTLLSLIHSCLWAQKQYNEQKNFIRANSVWVFGKYAGLDFNSGRPVPIQTGATSMEGTASACDPVTGELLFYLASSGEQAYDRNHQVMPNGDSLLQEQWCNSTMQTCIVPVIDSPGVYYVFSIPCISKPAPNLYYSIVDMSLNNGLGDVRSGQKTISLNTGPISEAVIAIPGNNCDIWLMVHKINRPEFLAFHITKEGINLNYVLSGPTGPDTNYWYRGEPMAVSPSRERIFITSVHSGSNAKKQCLLYKFDPNTGKVYDPLILENPKKSGPLGGSVSAAFSPDNSKLYLATMGDKNLGYIAQFDISIYDPIAIDTSMFILSYTGMVGAFDPFGLRLYRDTIFVGSARGNSSKHLSTINNPNLRGDACGMDSASIILLTGTYSEYGICNEIVYPFMEDNRGSLVMDTLICANQFSLELKASPGYNYYYWQDGYTGNQRQINVPGTYWVNSNRTGFRGGKFVPPIIMVNIFELSTMLAYDTYQWYLNGTRIPGATRRELQVSQNGNYTVEVNDKEGCTGLSDIYKITNSGLADPSLTASDIMVYPNPSRDVLYIHSSVKFHASLWSIAGNLLLEVNNENMITLKELASGLYLLKIKDQDGRLRQSIKVVKY